MSFTNEELGRILSEMDLSGFTVSLTGDLGRYIVGLTDNKERSLDLLGAQARFYGAVFDSITLGGRTNPTSNEVFVDIGTSVENLNEAMVLGKEFNQKCIRDNQEKLEIWIV